jgi:hypothetical protein
LKTRYYIWNYPKIFYRYILRSHGSSVCIYRNATRGYKWTLGEFVFTKDATRGYKWPLDITLWALSNVIGPWVWWRGPRHYDTPPTHIKKKVLPIPLKESFRIGWEYQEREKMICISIGVITTGCINAPNSWRATQPTIYQLAKAQATEA